MGLDDGNSLQYTGRENDGGGLYYYRARYYDPVLKRFISEDPIGLEAGPNFYAFVNGNPISFNDPLGLQAGGGGGGSGGSDPNSCQAQPSPAPNACGAKGGMPFPNSFPGGVNINSACAKHDQCYYSSWKTKAQCDKDFRDDLDDLCSRSTSPVMCRAAARAFGTGVAVGGGGAHDAAQSEMRRANDFARRMLGTGG